MRPAPAARDWHVPGIESIGALAEWLQISTSELRWFANLRGLKTRRPDDGSSDPLDHYYYQVHAKSSGGIRLLECPKKKLKSIQVKILEQILNGIPIHAAAHGFRSGCSIKTFAAPHVNKRVVLRVDLKNFFPSLNRARVQAMFQLAGYPEPVADLFGGLCTNAVPAGIFSRQELSHPDELFETRKMYGVPHLPQGAPITACSLKSVCVSIGLPLGGLCEIGRCGLYALR